MKVYLPLVQGKPQPPPLVVMTYNIGDDSNSNAQPVADRAAYLAAYLRGLAVDVACLQEVIWKGERAEVHALGEELSGWHAFSAQHNKQNHYWNMIVTPHPIAGGQLLHTIVSPAGRQDRVNLSVLIRAPFGLVRVFNIHTRFEEAEHGTRQSLRWARTVTAAEDVPFLIMGDFNKTRGEVERIAAEEGLRVTISRAGRIDHILSAGLQLRDDRAADKPHVESSHYPIVAVYEKGADMAQDFFNEVMVFVFAREGGFVNHPADPGGATNMGITIGTLSRWLGRPATVEEVKNLDKQTATAIYRAYYWEPSGAARAQDYATALVLMDSGILHGVGAAQAWVREYGYNLHAILARRLRVYTASKNWSVFGKGWTNRVALLLAEIAR